MAAEPGIDLAQAKQLEMIDQERAEEHDGPAEPEDCLHGDNADWVVH